MKILDQVKQLGNVCSRALLASILLVPDSHQTKTPLESVPGRQTHIDITELRASIFRTLAEADKDKKLATNDLDELEITEEMRCLPCLQYLCRQDVCKPQQLYLAMDEETYQANNWADYQHNTVACPQLSHRHRDRQFAANQFNTLQTLFIDGELARRDGAGYYRPLEWFDRTSPIVQEVFAHTVFTRAPIGSSGATGQSGIIDGEYLVLNTDGSVNLKQRQYTDRVITFGLNLNTTQPESHIRTIMHEMAHALFSRRREFSGARPQFATDIRNLLSIVKPSFHAQIDDALTDLELHHLPQIFDIFLAQERGTRSEIIDPIPLLLSPEQLERNISLRRTYPRYVTNIRGVATVSNSANWFIDEDMWQSLSRHNRPDTVMFKRRAMFFLFGLVSNISREMTSFGPLASQEQFDHVVEDECYAYLLGRGDVPPNLLYAYRDVLTPEGIQWATGWTFNQQDVGDYANPYMNTEVGRNELRKSFTAFWEFVRANPTIAAR